MEIHRSHSSHSARSPREQLSVTERFGSSARSAAVLFFFVNVTWNTWPVLSVLSVYFCVAMNESFFLDSYRNALCETTDAFL